MQFIMLDINLIKDPNLTNDEVITYALLCDRMKSSRTSKQFFDSKKQDYYVIYTLEQMATSLKVSIRKVGQIFSKLVKLGLLIKKKQFSKADKLFLPKFKSTKVQNLQQTNADSATPQMQKVQPNQSQQNQKIKSKSNTVNTSDEFSNKSVAKWKKAVCGKLNVKEIVIDQILDFTKNDLKQAHSMMGVILNAKTNIARKNKLLNSPITRFENNTNLGNKLAMQLKHIFSYLPATMEERSKYLMKSMKTFFLEAFGLKKDELITPIAASSNRIIKKPVPEWLRKDYQPKVKPATEAQKQAVLKKLEEFRKL